MGTPQFDSSPSSPVAICINCRTRLAPGEPCDGGHGHRTARLGVHQERQRLLREIWGPPSVRRRAKQLAKAGGGGLGLGTALESCTWCGGNPASLSGGTLVVLLVLAVAALVFVLAYYLVNKLVEYVRVRRHRLRPHGAVDRPWAMLHRGRVGVAAVGAGNLVAPASAADCLAYGLELRASRFLRGDLMLRDAQTAGFELRLDDGTVVRIPKGRVRLAGGFERVAPSGERWEQYLAALEPTSADDEEYGLLPHDVVLEAKLLAGQPVRIVGELEPVTATLPQRDNYRAAPRTVLEPRGIPILVLPSER